MYKLGLNAKLKVAANEVKNCKDVTLSLTVDAADATTRASGGWKQEVPTLKNAEISFNTLYKADDPAISAMQTAFLAGNTVPVEMSGSSTFKADCYVSNFSLNQPLADIINVDVTLKPAPSEEAPTLTADTISE